MGADIIDILQSPRQYMPYLTYLSDLNNVFIDVTIVINHADPSYDPYEKPTRNTQNQCKISTLPKHTAPEPWIHHTSTISYHVPETRLNHTAALSPMSIPAQSTTY